MEESTVKNTPKSAKRLRSSSGVNEITIKEKKSDKIITNGTGNISDHSEQEAGKAKAQPTKVSKVVKKTKGDTPKSVQKSAKKVEPETSNIEEPFLGFEEDELISIKENTKLFLNHINGLETNGEPAASTSSSEAVAEAEVSEVPAEAEAEDVQEKETEEQDMTVDTAAATSDDTDSDQMEIDSKASDRADKSKESDVDVMDSELENSDKQTPKSDKENVGANAKVEYCGACSAQVDDAEEGICCDGVCERWFHLKCSGLSQAEYDELSLDENAKWACPKCSGKPPPTLAAEPKTPKISVRKDLQKTPGPSLAKRKSIAAKDGAVKTPKIDISNPAFLKPFDFGWKRELVYRTSNESVGNNKRNGDVYYYTPKGKKLRSLREISEHMAGTDLTIDNFTFWKEPLGIDNPEKEIIRDAKYKLQNKDGTASPSLVAKKLPATPKAVKTPKTTPKLSATITLPVSESTTPKASLAVTPRVMLKGKANATVTPKVKIAPSKTVTPKPVISKEKKKKLASDDEMEIGMLPPTWEPTPKRDKTLGVCSINCLPAMGTIPTLQCVSCLCLYHMQCVGLEEASLQSPIHNYKCKNCQLEKNRPVPIMSSNGTKPTLPPPPLTPISALNNTSSGGANPLSAPPKLQRIADVRQATSRANNITLPKNTSIVGGVTTWLPPSSTIQLRPAPPPPQNLMKFSPLQKVPPPATPPVDPSSSQPVQALVTVAGTRYIVVPKHNVLSVGPSSTTSSTQVLESSSVHTTTTASDPNSALTSSISQNFSSVPHILPKSQTSPSTLIVSPPKGTTMTAFQNPQGPPGVLLVPYINNQQSPNQPDGQQPQYVLVNNSSGIPSGNFIFGNIPQSRQLILPTVPTCQPSEPSAADPTGATKRALEMTEESPAAKRLKADAPPSPVMKNFMQNLSYMRSSLLHAFQYLKVQELLRASRVNHLWHDLALHKSLWDTVKMKNSQVKDWEGFAATLKRCRTRHLDLRKILVPGKDDTEAVKNMWAECVKALAKVDSLVKIEFCRCTSSLIQQIAQACPQLEYISAVFIKDNEFDFIDLEKCTNLTELKLKSQGGIKIKNISTLTTLSKLKNLSLLTVKNMNEVLEAIGELTQLESLELGEMTNIDKEVVTKALAPLTKLKRLRLEKGQNECPTDAILTKISELPNLNQLELINFDIKQGFDNALALCSNIKTLLVIPTYVTQSATTNHLVIEGVGQLSKTLNHFVWGLTLELLRVTDLFIDQWEQNQNSKSPTSQPPPKKSGAHDSIPILKPSSKDSKSPNKEGLAVTQVDVLQLPKLHKVLTTVLPNTKIIILKVPFNATWRQTINSNSN